MACQFSLPLQMPVLQAMELAQQAMASIGGQMGGDENKGAFRVTQGTYQVEGLYRTEPGWLHVQLTRKPMLLSCGKVERLLSDALADAHRRYLATRSPDGDASGRRAA